MRTLLLTKIEISNWRGQNRVVYFYEGDTTIKGKNGSGKTSVMAAWYWLLSGHTDVNTPQNYNLFDNTKELTKDTPTASVKAWIKIGHIEWVIEKRVAASFKRDKASDTWVKSQSDTYTYKIDEIEVSATDFKGWIEGNICPINVINFCMCGQFFSALAIEDKKQARAYLESICGEITFEDLKDRDYSTLKGMFAKGYTIEKIKESFKSTLKSVNESAKKIPLEIESRSEVIAELQKTDFDAIGREVEKCKAELEEINEKIALQSALTENETGELNAIFEEIASKRTKMHERREEYLDEQNLLKREIKGKISEVKGRNARVLEDNRQRLAKFKENKRSLDAEKSYLEKLLEERQRLVMERSEAKALVFKEERCSFCGQELPDGMLEEQRCKFYEKKDKYIESIVKQGVAMKAKIEASEVKINELQSLIDDYKGDVELESYDDLKNQLREIEANEVAFEDTEEYKTMQAEIKELIAKSDEIRNRKKSEDLEGSRKEIMDKMFECTRQLGKRDLIEKYTLELESLQEKQRELGIQCAELEGKIALCDAYVEEKARIIAERINFRLEGCEIQMWERLKNGDLAPACTIQSKDGVKLSTINHSRRLLIEAELQKMFCETFGIQMPIFYDEANVFDSEHKPTNEDGWQVILLQASDDDKLVVD